MGKCTFVEMQRFLLKSLCKDFKDRYYKVFYSAIAKGEPYPSYFEVDTEIYRKAGLMYLWNLQDDLNLQKTAFLNNIGISYEKEGLIDKAIETYEECAKVGYKASHCYDRLRILYKKRKDFDNMNRIIARKTEVYSQPLSWVEEEIDKYFDKK